MYSTISFSKSVKYRTFLSFLYHSKDLPEMLENELVLKIAEKHDKSPAQVLLRFIVQKNIAVIPKSTNPQRLASNIQVSIELLFVIGGYRDKSYCAIVNRLFFR